MLPAARPLRVLSKAAVLAALETALREQRGVDGAHCVHELWMREEFSAPVEHALERLWARCAATVPEWLPMRYFELLPQLYQCTAGFVAQKPGRHNVYVVLLDFRDHRTADPYGVYVGMSHYSPAQRFDQHKAGIRSAGSVLKRGLETLTGPVLHLQRISRADARRIERDLALALAAAGLRTEGGH